MQKIVFAVLAAGLCIASALAEEAPAGIKRTPLQTAAFPDGYNTVAGLAEIAPGTSSGPHTHPGLETGYLLEGEVLLVIEGQPDRTLKAGDSYLIPAGMKHDVKSIGTVPAKAMAVYVVDKAKPLASPAK